MHIKVPEKSLFLLSQSGRTRTTKNYSYELEIHVVSQTVTDEKKLKFDVTKYDFSVAKEGNVN